MNYIDQFSLKGSSLLTCDKLSETPLSIQSEPPVAVAMGTSDWDFHACDCLNSALLPESWFLGESIHVCVLRQDGSGPCCCCCETPLWNLVLLLPFILAAKRQYALFIPHQRPALSPTSAHPLFLNLCGHSVRSCVRPAVLLLKVATGGDEALHRISVWAAFKQVRSLCGDVKRDRLENLNVDARRDASLMSSSSTWITINHGLSEALAMNKVVHVLKSVVCCVLKCFNDLINDWVYL